MLQHPVSFRIKKNAPFLKRKARSQRNREKTERLLGADELVHLGAALGASALDHLATILGHGLDWVFNLAGGLALHAVAFHVYLHRTIELFSYICMSMSISYCSDGYAVYRLRK